MSANFLVLVSVCSFLSERCTERPQVANTGDAGRRGRGARGGRASQGTRGAGDVGTRGPRLAGSHGLATITVSRTAWERLADGMGAPRGRHGSASRTAWERLADGMGAPHGRQSCKTGVSSTTLLVSRRFCMISSDGGRRGAKRATRGSRSNLRLVRCRGALGHPGRHGSALRTAWERLADGIKPRTDANHAKPA